MANASVQCIQHVAIDAHGDMLYTMNVYTRVPSINLLNLVPGMRVAHHVAHVCSNLSDTAVL